ncbi:hypothetical protein ACFOEK_18740 [Litoribrevibacter euphylliae]|uniref:Uncharacterized protein n=1 Tax=Litoribrevibacter euphylliae TaxID=1834034 RepID=A0ABV7HKV6_9GAMM
MKTLKPIKELSCISFAIIAFSGSVYAVEPLTDTEMGETVVLDPFGATAAGGQIDTTLSAREESAINADEANQTLANDPNSKQLPITSEDYSSATEQPEVAHTTTNYYDGININSLGTIDRVHIEKLIDNTGANRGSRTVQNINVNSAASIYHFR